MLDGKYWVVYGQELLGVTTDESKILDVLRDAYLSDRTKPVPGSPEYTLRLKFDTYTLLVDGLPKQAYYATNAAALDS
jgi:hypothetical protein